MIIFIDYLRLIGYFAVASLVWGSIAFMRRIWYVPLMLGFWFCLSGIMLLAGILSKDISITSTGMTYFGTPVLFAIALSIMRAYWSLATRKFHERSSDK